MKLLFEIINLHLQSKKTILPIFSQNIILQVFSTFCIFFFIGGGVDTLTVFKTSWE